MRPEAGSRPGGRGTCSLLRQRKVPKRKATLLSASLRCATGNLRCSAKAGSRANSPAAQTSTRPDPLLPTLLGADRRALRNGFRLGFGVSAPRTRTRKARSGWACAERQKRDQGCALSEPQASLRRPPLLTWSAGCPEGDPDCGSPFFWFLFFGEAKKRDLPPGNSRPAA